MSSMILYPTPPPTFNTLDATQRTRLMRTTRKLGAVLGTTPFLLETAELYQLLPIGINGKERDRLSAFKGSSIQADKARRRQGSIFTIDQLLPPSPSTESMATPVQSQAEPLPAPHCLPEAASFSNRPRRSGDAPRQLLLQVNPVPVSSTDPRLPIPLASPRRTRSETSNTRRPSYTTHRHSIISPLSPSFRFHANTIPEVRRQKIAKLTRHLGENIPPHLVFPDAEALAPTAEIKARRRRSRSVDQLYLPVQISVETVSTTRLPSQFRPKPVDLAQEWPESPNRPSDRNMPADQQNALPDRSADWKGEWSGDDHKDVMNRLRALKTRK